MFWEEQEKALREIYRVLKSGGWAYVGGNLGHKDTEIKIRQMMKERNVRGKRKHPRKENGCLLTPEAYTDILVSMNCSFRIIDNPGHDFWIVFRKM